MTRCQAMNMQMYTQAFYTQAKLAIWLEVLDHVQAKKSPFQEDRCPELWNKSPEILQNFKTLERHMSIIQQVPKSLHKSIILYPFDNYATDYSLDIISFFFFLPPILMRGYCTSVICNSKSDIGHITIDANQKSFSNPISCP